MKLYTPITIQPSSFTIRYQDSIRMLGSCFSDYMAKQMKTCFFNVESNPVGTLFNPISIAHHSDYLVSADVAVITFGTAWVYIDQLLPPSDDWKNNVVDNCLKRPAREFERRRLTVEDIVDTWLPIVNSLTNTRFIFTVSPVRHIKDGLHENQLSKAILLQAVEQLLLRSANYRITYFPAYEILLDELRDYRFYAADMVHPSEVATEYIFERFSQTFLYEEDTQQDMRTLHQLFLDLNHRPLHPESEEYKQFMTAVLDRKQQLATKFPHIL